MRGIGSWGDRRTNSCNPTAQTSAITGFLFGWPQLTRPRCVSWCWMRGGWSCPRGSPQHMAVMASSLARGPYWFGGSEGVHLTQTGDTWGCRFCAQTFVGSMAPERRVRTVEVVEVLPLLELGIEERGVVDDHAVEQSVELFVIDAVRPLYFSVEPGGRRLDVHVLDAAIQDVPVKGAGELGTVVGLDQLDPEGQSLQDVVDELNRCLLVESVVELEDPEPSAVVNSSELVVPLASAGNRGDEFDIDLEAETRLGLLVPLPPLLMTFVPLRAGQSVEAKAPQNPPDAAAADLDVVIALEIHRRSQWPEVVVLPQVDDLADHVLSCRSWAGVWSSGTVAETIHAEFLVAPEPLVEAVPADPVIATGPCDAAADFFGVPDDGEPPRRSLG